MPDFTNYELVSNLLSIDNINPSEEGNALIEQLIPQVTAKIQRITGLDWFIADYDEYYSPTGTQYLNLNQYPVNSVSSIRTGCSNTSSGQLVDSDYYHIDYASGQIFYSSVWASSGWNSAVWTGSKNSIRVAFNAGYAEEDITPDLQGVATDIVASLYKKASTSDSITSEKIGQYAYTLTNSIDYNKQLRDKLSDYISVDKLLPNLYESNF